MLFARGAHKTPYCFVGHTVISGYLAKRFHALKYTVHHVRPFVRGNSLFRLLWGLDVLVYRAEAEYCQALVRVQQAFERACHAIRQNESRLVRARLLPVGSGRLFMSFSSNNRTDVLTHSGTHTVTLSCLCIIIHT
jgi:hypothetical protein